MNAHQGEFSLGRFGGAETSTSYGTDFDFEGDCRTTAGTLDRFDALGENAFLYTSPAECRRLECLYVNTDDGVRFDLHLEWWLPEPSHRLQGWAFVDGATRKKARRLVETYLRHGRKRVLENAAWAIQLNGGVDGREDSGPEEANELI